MGVLEQIRAGLEKKAVGVYGPTLLIEVTGTGPVVIPV
jgi:hypothetical protein